MHKSFEVGFSGATKKSKMEKKSTTNNFAFPQKFPTFENFLIFQGLIHKIKNSKNIS